MFVFDFCVKYVEGSAQATMFGVMWCTCSILSSGFYMIVCGIVPHYFGFGYADEIFGVLNFAYGGCVVFLSLIKPSLESLQEAHGHFLVFLCVGLCSAAGGLTCLGLPSEPLPKIQASDPANGLPVTITGSRRRRNSPAA